jgi:hypothetical protein
MMCHSLLIRANGEIPCWDDVGEKLMLRSLDEKALRNGQEPPIFYGVELSRIWQEFLCGRDPNPELCHSCAMPERDGIEPALRPRPYEPLDSEVFL